MTAPTAWGPGLKRIGSFLFREKLLVFVIAFIFWDSQARANEQSIQSADVKNHKKGTPAHEAPRYLDGNSLLSPQDRKSVV